MDEQSRRELGRRIGSALVLAPVALAAIYLGTPYFEILLIAGALAMSWEWDRICGEQRFGASGWAMAVCLVAAVVAVALGYSGIGLAIVAFGAFAVYGTALAVGRAAPTWTAAGVVAVGVPCMAALWLRLLPETGLETFVWLIGAVWTTDLAAYVTGRLVGGAKLAPRISPGKTWAGLIGAVVATAIWGAACAAWAGAGTPWIYAGLGAVAAVMAQAGDLAVSFVKRRFGVKDASNLIPGHGGVLDRFDGLLLVTPAMAALAWWNEGDIFTW